MYNSDNANGFKWVFIDKHYWQGSMDDFGNFFPKVILALWQVEGLI